MINKISARSLTLLIFAIGWACSVWLTTTRTFDATTNVFSVKCLIR